MSLLVGWLIDPFGQDWSISTTVGWTWYYNCLNTNITCHLVIWQEAYGCITRTPKCFSLTSQYPHSWESCGFWGMCFFFAVCVGGVFFHGRMSLDGNKLKEVFQDSVSKACFLIMVIMHVDDTKQMEGWSYRTTSLCCTALPSTGIITVPGETVMKLV